MNTSNNKKIVYVAMRGDLINSGHINVLTKASSLGKVIVGLLSDEAIESYKKVEKLQKTNNQLEKKMDELLVETPNTNKQETNEQKTTEQEITEQDIEQKPLIGGKINFRKKRTRKKYN